MNEVPHLSQVCGSANGAKVDVLFVHGITGNSAETWTGAGKEYWPEWLCKELEGVCVYAIGYPSSIFERWVKKEMNLHERATNMLEHLAAHGIGTRPVAVVSHSLGGILVKEMLRMSNECTDDGWKQISNQTRLVVFMATPHTGASLASTVKLFVPRLASTYIDLLTNESGYLTSLNLSYRDLASAKKIATVAYYEKFKTKAVLVVSEESADPGVAGTRPVPVDANHIDICKPATRDDFVFTSLCRHIKTLLKQCLLSTSSGEPCEPFAPDDYGAPSESDRRDLLQKLIDAGREHEYQRANNLQNKFARRYYKLGLHTEAKTISDAVLSAVEQRFVTHVHNCLICKGASDDQIAAALQAHVIDALCSVNGPGSLSPTGILQALYFLTEQCYIQWDAP